MKKGNFIYTERTKGPNFSEMSCDSVLPTGSGGGFQADLTTYLPRLVRLDSKRAKQVVLFTDNYFSSIFEESMPIAETKPFYIQPASDISIAQQIACLKGAIFYFFSMASYSDADAISGNGLVYVRDALVSAPAIRVELYTFVNTAVGSMLCTQLILPWADGSNDIQAG